MSLKGLHLILRFEEWINHGKAWWKRLNKMQRTHVTLAWFMMGMGVVVIILGIIVFAQLNTAYKSGSINYDDPKVIRNILDLAVVSGLILIFGVSVMLAFFMWSFGILHYTFYLESRIQQLEEFRRRSQ